MTSTIQWNNETRLLKELKVYDKNPRKLDKHNAIHIEESLDKFGLCQPIIINTDNTIIGGHQRAKILKKTGHKEVEVKVPNRTLNSQEVEELNIRLNRNGGSWDWDILGNLFNPNDLLDYGFELKDLEIEEEQEEKPKPCKVVVTFKSDEEFLDFLPKLETLASEYSTAKVK